MHEDTNAFSFPHLTQSSGFRDEFQFQEFFCSNNQSEFCSNLQLQIKVSDFSSRSGEISQIRSSLLLLATPPEPTHILVLSLCSSVNQNLKRSRSSRCVKSIRTRRSTSTASAAAPPPVRSAKCLELTKTARWLLSTTSSTSRRSVRRRVLQVRIPARVKVCVSLPVCRRSLLTASPCWWGTTKGSRPSSASWMRPSEPWM